MPLLPKVLLYSAMDSSKVVCINSPLIPTNQMVHIISSLREELFQPNERLKTSKMSYSVDNTPVCSNITNMGLIILLSNFQLLVECNNWPIRVREDCIGFYIFYRVISKRCMKL